MSKKSIVEKNRKANEFVDRLIKILSDEGYTKADMIKVFKLAKKKFDFRIKPKYE